MLGGSVKLHAPAALLPVEKSGTNFTGGWVGDEAGLYRSGKSHAQRGSIPENSNP